MEKKWTYLEKWIYVLVKRLFTLCNRELSCETFKIMRQFIRFGIIGISNTALSYVIYVIALLAFQRVNVLLEHDYIVAQILAFILSVAWSFYWNNKLVFVSGKEERSGWWKKLLKTYIAYSFTGLFLNSILIVFWVQILRLSEYIAPMLNLIISVPINFIINKFWAFRSKP